MTIDFKIGPPKEFSNQETEDFLGLLIQQNQIENPTIEKVNNCILLCLAHYQNELIGIGAIKQVYKTPFDKAGVSELKDNYNYELGYLFIKEDKEIRGKGIAKAICNFLISQVSKKNIFATTEQSQENSMIYILQGLNFKKTGETYTGAKTKKNIGLYLLEGTKRIDLIFNVFKELKYFVAKENIQTILHNLWNDQNPTLTHGK